jgi:hypothetical protein
MIIALITRRNSPNVKTVNGMVRITSIGFTIVFKIDNIIETRMAVMNESTVTPGSRYAERITAIVESRSRVRKFIIFNF